MMIRRRDFLAASLAAGASLPLVPQAKSAGAIVQPDEDEIRSVIHKYVRAPDVPIGVAVGAASPSFGTTICFDGELVDHNRNSLAFDANTAFEIASNTKTVTSTLYEYFVQTGAIGPDATLGNYFSSSSIGQLIDIPLIDLATYTSGLPSDNVTVTDLPSPLYAPYTDSEMFQFLGATPPFFSQVENPGRSYSYSNLGFALLAQAIGKAVSGGDSYEQLIQEYVLGPLQMNATQLYSAFTGALPLAFNQQIGFTAQNDQYKRSGPGWVVLPAYNGAGGLVSTPVDMMTWLQFNMGMIENSSLSGLLPTLQTPATSVKWDSGNGSFLGVGWFLERIYNDAGSQIHIVWKDGALRGFTSLVGFLQTSAGTPSSAGVFVLTNSNGDAVYNVAYDLLFMMAGLEPPINKGRYPRVLRSAASLG